MAKNTERINFIIDRKMLYELRRRAKQQHRTLSSVMREALSLYVNLPDAVQYGGVFEQSADAPRDTGESVAAAE